MDKMTLGLLISLGTVFCFWFKLRLDENRALVSELKKEEENRLARLDRIKQLTNKN